MTGGFFGDRSRLTRPRWIGLSLPPSLIWLLASYREWHPEFDSARMVRSSIKNPGTSALTVKLLSPSFTLDRHLGRTGS